MGCIFCDIVSGETESFVIASDQKAVAFLDINPFANGHTLVVPTRHVTDLLDGGADVLADIAPVLHETAQLLVDRLGADGINMFQSSGTAAGQEVFHLHMHLLPRWRGDGLLKDLVGTPSAVDDLEGLHHRLTDH
jgi:histidine triad (HIT) family protein